MHTQELFLLLVVAILLLITAFIQTHYQKKRIQDLEKKLSESKNKYAEAERKLIANSDEIRLLKWQIAHPPKYKTGHKFDLWIISSCELHKPSLSEFLTKAVLGLISICAGYFPKEKKSDALDMYWEYELTHTGSGGKKKIIESKLENFKPE